MNQKSLHRIFDANFNRLKEALRVIEEVARFLKNQKKISAKAKALRHEVQKILIHSPLSYKKCLEARDSSGDVGRKMRVKDKKRIKYEDLMISNFKRAEESSRVLEEFFKLTSEKTSKKFQSLRFKIYSLEKEILK